MNPTGGGPGGPWTHDQHRGHGESTASPPSDYGPGSWDAQQTKGSPIVRALLIILLVAFIVMGACGACSYCAYKMGTGYLSEEVASALGENPVLMEHVGEIESLEFDLGASTAEPESDVFVFTVEGSRGSGRLLVRLGTAADEPEVIGAILEMEDGTTHDLFPEDEHGPDVRE